MFFIFWSSAQGPDADVCSWVEATKGVDGATDDMALAAGLIGLLPHIKACANTFVDSLKLSASNVASLKASTLTFSFVGAARANGFKSN